MNWPKKVLQAQIESLIAQREELEMRLVYVLELQQNPPYDTLVFDEPVHHGPPAELANLRADLEAVCRERDVLQDSVKTLRDAVDGYRAELRELDAVRAELDKLRGLSDAYRNRALINLKDRDEARAELKKLRASIQSSPMDSTPGTC